MLKPFFIALFLFLLTCTTNAQDQKAIDSLTTIIREAKHDTSLATAYIELSNILSISKPDTILPLCTKAKEIAETNLEKHLSPAIKKKYLSSLADALNNIGVFNVNKGNYQLALDQHWRSLKIREEIEEKKGIASSLNSIAIIFDDQGDISSALKYYHRSLKIREDIGDKKGTATCLNNLGYVYRNQGDYQKALEYNSKAFKIREEVGDKKGMAASLTGIASIYQIQGDDKKALELNFKSLKIREEIGYHQGISTSLNNIAGIYYRRGDFQKALEYCTKSLNIYEAIGYKFGITVSLINIGNIFLKEGNIGETKDYARKSMEFARELKSPRHIKDAAWLFFRVFKMQGDFERSLEYYELHILMRDSIKNDATQKAAIRQQTQYEFEKVQLIKKQKEKEKARIASEVKGRRDNLQYSMILIAILILFGGVLSLGFIKVSSRIAEGIIFFSFLILFEFLLVLADPYIEGWSGGAPGIKLLFNAGIAALIFPAHAFFEARLRGQLVKVKE